MTAQKVPYLAPLYSKILAGALNSVDPVQTAGCSGSVLFAFAILSEILMYEILGHLTYVFMEK